MSGSADAKEVAMRLSEAIRLGSMLGPQALGAFKRTVTRGFFRKRESTEYCALGGAYAAIGGRSTVEEAGADSEGFRGAIKAGDKVEVMDTPPEWQFFFARPFECPQCGRFFQGKRLVPHLNDDHRWTREEIAGLVARVENALGVPESIQLVQIASRRVGDGETHGVLR